MQALLKAGVHSFDKLAEADPRRLETITGRKYPYGDQLKSSLDSLPPKVDINLQMGAGRDECRLTLTRPSQPRLFSTNFHMAELVR